MSHRKIKCILGEQELQPGEHIFRLQLTGRREAPDKHYALWFDAIILRPVPAAKP